MQSTQPREPALGPSCRCPLNKALFVSSLCSRFSCSCSDFKRWCWGDKSHTLSAPIIPRPATCLVTPPYLPLVSLVSRGTSAPEESALEVQEAPGADGTSLGAIGVEVDGASLFPGDGAGGFLKDSVMRGTGISAPRSTAPGDATPAPGSSGAAGPGVPRLHLSGSPDSPLLPID
jgi:hypothetical protein